MVFRFMLHIIWYFPGSYSNMWPNETHCYLKEHHGFLWVWTLKCQHTTLQKSALSRPFTIRSTMQICNWKFSYSAVCDLNPALICHVTKHRGHGIISVPHGAAYWWFGVFFLFKHLFHATERLHSVDWWQGGLWTCIYTCNTCMKWAN